MGGPAMVPESSAPASLPQTVQGEWPGLREEGCPLRPRGAGEASIRRYDVSAEPSRGSLPLITDTPGGDRIRRRRWSCWMDGRDELFAPRVRPTKPASSATTHRPTQGVVGPRADRLRCVLAWPTARFVENASSCPELTPMATSPSRIMCVAPGSRYSRWGVVASVSASPRSASASTCTAVQYSSRLRCSCGVWSSAASPGP